MIELKTQYPFIDDKNISHDNLIKHYAEDENGKQYYIKQVETGIEYSSAVDLYPSRYNYGVTDKLIEEFSEIENNIEKEEEEI